MKILYFLFSSIFWVPFVSNSTLSYQSFHRYIKSLQEDAFYKHATLGISVRDIKTKEVLGSFNEHKMLIPASSLKLLTTFSAYTILGKDFRYETQVLYDGSIREDGTLLGNIIIVGSGDPTLGSERIKGNPGFENILEQITKTIQKKGITSIEGDIIADISVYNDFPVAPSWQWNDVGNYYAAGTWGINILENEYALFFQRDKSIGSPAKIQYLHPYIPDLMVHNEVTIAEEGTGDNVYIYEGPRHYTKKATGTVPYGRGLFKVKGAMPDPPLYVAYMLQQKLKTLGIPSKNIRTDLVSEKRDSLQHLVSFVSPPLQKIVELANLESINLYCESLLLTLGVVKCGIGSRDQGILEIQKMVDSLGIDSDGMYMEDGSGLSTRNLISADFFTSFLSKMMEIHGEKQISDMIPRAGEGTLRTLLIQSPVQPFIRAKSGSMNMIQSYTGICTTKTGKKVTFSIMLNGSSAPESKTNRQQLEKIITAIYNSF